MIFPIKTTQYPLATSYKYSLIGPTNTLFVP